MYRYLSLTQYYHEIMSDAEADAWLANEAN